jgi:peptidoglycan/xylan/chitin deacetylase (PgdA/CDA1 family)
MSVLGPEGLGDASPGPGGLARLVLPRTRADDSQERRVKMEPSCRGRPCGVLFVASAILVAGLARAGEDSGTPILVYHRFGPIVADSMTVRTSVFEAQLQQLEQQGHTVIPLKTLVAHLRGDELSLPPRSVVVTVDDAHRSVYTEALPLLRKHHIPVTLFIYPSAVSRAGYSMTWEQLRELVSTGLLDVGSHTYWHPNFAREKKRLSEADYQHLVEDQLTRSRSVLESRLGTRVNLLAWPFGIYDDELMRRAAEAGYVAAVTLERRPASAADPLLALPRYLVTDADQGARFEALLAGRSAARGTRREMSVR